MALANETFAELGIDTIDLSAEMLDTYVSNPDAPVTFEVVYAPTSYQWGGWDNPVAVGETEIGLWTQESEQPEGHTFFVANTKTEHPAGRPRHQQAALHPEPDQHGRDARGGF